MGLVHSVTPPDQLMKEAGRILDPIFRNPQHALSQAKRALRASLQGPLAGGLRAERNAFGRCFSNDFFVELMRKQLDEGVLKTTVKLPARVLKGKGKKS